MAPDSSLEDGHLITGIDVIGGGGNGLYCRATRIEVSVFPDEMRLDPASAMDAEMWVVAVEYAGRGRWAVRRGSPVYPDSQGRHICMRRDGTWVVEPFPSSRDSEWRAEHRFTKAEAMRLAAEHAPHLELNGWTALEILARHQRGNGA